MSGSAPQSLVLVPVHVGYLAPEASSRPPAPVILGGGQGHSWPGRRGAKVRQSLPTSADVDWSRHGFEPRWLGTESAACAVAVQPSIFHNSGAAELKRFLAGTASREETALVVSMLGHAYDDTPVSVLHPGGDSISLPDLQGSIDGTPLPSGTRPRLASGLAAAEHDLGLRLLNRPKDAPWWSLRLRAVTLHPGAGGSPIT